MKNYVTIFFNARDDYIVYAHELGHNLGLQHTFPDTDPDPLIILGEKKTTNNFMDYSPVRNSFYKFQWEILNNKFFKDLLNK